ncbi:uncharacterized protein EAE97_004095 [Botrytis byssoidea]|uniref:Uncharacterized protein n=1 Tax=Botrytis byssoidea TaxID=139641 RepID=A0A9P5LVW0_9HELO|nr:uncharacterized protein EAE97_004095 [Botrytis byssoidea]KAF7946846.1 hypothetical protein EAE97_004095 [Botrytis byssoidea]
MMRTPHEFQSTAKANPFQHSTQVNQTDRTYECDHPVVKTFSNLLNSSHHPFAGARCSSPAGASDSPFVR